MVNFRKVEQIKGENYFNLRLKLFMKEIGLMESLLRERFQTIILYIKGKSKTINHMVKEILYF